MFFQDDFCNQIFFSNNHAQDKEREMVQAKGPVRIDVHTNYHVLPEPVVLMVRFCKTVA